MNFVMDKDMPSKIRTDIVLSDRDTGKLFSNKFRQIFIELPNFNKEEDECENDFERWIYILKHMDTLDRALSSWVIFALEANFSSRSKTALRALKGIRSSVSICFSI